MYSGVARSSYRQHCWSGRGHLSHEVRMVTPQRERSGIGRGTPQSANQLTDWRRRRWRKEISYERIGIHLFQKFALTIRPGKLSKVHFSRKFQGRVHLNFWLSGSPISPYFHPKNLPIPPKVYLLKVQGTKSKASIDFHYPL